MVTDQKQSFSKNVKITDKAISHNIQKILTVIPDISKIYFVLKANAYGHGIDPIIKQLINHNCRKVAVESTHTAVQIRMNGFDGEILILNPVPHTDICCCVENQFTITVNCEEQISKLVNECTKINKHCKIHLNLDVGLHRVGSSKETIYRIAKLAKQNSRLLIEGVYAHPKSKNNFMDEYLLLKEVYDKLIDEGNCMKNMHYADSSVVLEYPDIAQKGARIGTLLYGILPKEIKQNNSLALKLMPVMSVRTNIIKIHDIKKGETLGYYSNKKMDNDTRIAVIPMGYANGLDRKSVLANINVLINGTRVSLCGNIFMNSSYVNISELPNCKMGDEVVIIGKQCNEEITISEVANSMNTIPAEIMVRIGNANEY